MNLILHTGQGMGKTFLDLLQTGERYSIFMSSFPVRPPLCLSLLHMLINAVEEFCLSDRRAYKQG